jgi:selenocysteine-specific elongation factor
MEPGDADRTLRVVATAGHVDHGKSALIVKLTGIDPDRLAEEKRRGLTIDLGFAWATLPSGQEVGFVDVPGHERFVRNMLAGVGPVRLVLFVVAADEGWKPQSEEHLEIVDLLGVEGAVIALTKTDLVDDETLAARIDQVRGRLAHTALAGAPIVPCSAFSGQGVDALREALDAMIARAPLAASDGRPRQFVDRVFTIKGAGTVVTGTLTGGPLAVGMEAEVLPSGHRARIRGLQTHKRALQEARPVSRLAANLAGTTKADLVRGDALVLPGDWRPSTTIEVLLRPVRTLDHPLTSRGAFKFYAGSAERDARLRFLGASELLPKRQAFARIRLSSSVVLDFKDAFVLREAGRQQTVAGGLVLDTDPPLRPGTDAVARLEARLSTGREELPALLVEERGRLRTADVHALTGSTAGARPASAHQLGSWLVAGWFLESVTVRLVEALRAHHLAHPLSPGVEVSDVVRTLRGLVEQDLLEAILGHLSASGLIVRDHTVVRLSSHQPSTAGRDDAGRLVEAVRSAEPSPPTVKELVATGFGPELIRAACADGRLVRVSPDIVISPELMARAERIVRDLARPPGITVSAFREALGTSRKYALPILEHFDAGGLTRRQGDLRVLRG